MRKLIQPLIYFLIILLSLSLSECQQSNKSRTMNHNENKMETEVINYLRQKTDQMISDWGRKEVLFKINIEKSALVIIDMQNFVCTAKKGKGLRGIENVISNTNKLVDICHQLSVPVIWVKENINTNNSSSDGGLYSLFHDSEHIKIIENHGVGTEIYSKMHFNQTTDYVVFKNRYSAFLTETSELQSLLDSLNKNQLIFTGVATNVCVESTVRDAMQLDFEVILVSDATTTFDEIVKEVTLMNTRLFFGDVRSTQDVINEIISLTKE